MLEITTPMVTPLPFHQSICRALKECAYENEVRLLCTLIERTNIPDGHDEILGALEPWLLQMTLNATIEHVLREKHAAKNKKAEKENFAIRRRGLIVEIMQVQAIVREVDPERDDDFCVKLDDILLRTIDAKTIEEIEKCFTEFRAMKPGDKTHLGIHL